VTAEDHAYGTSKHMDIPHSVLIVWTCEACKSFKGKLSVCHSVFNPVTHLCESEILLIVAPPGL